MRFRTSFFKYSAVKNLFPIFFFTFMFISIFCKIFLMFCYSTISLSLMLNTTSIMFCFSCNLGPITKNPISISTVHTIEFLEYIEIGEFSTIHNTNIVATFDVGHSIEGKANTMIDFHPNIHNDKGDNDGIN